MGVHYFYMREFWVQIGTSPIVYRYIDWSITVPLQMIEFYLILSAVQPDLSLGIFWPISSTRLGFVWPSGRPPRQTLWRKSTRRGCLVETWVCPSLVSSNCPAACKVNLE